MQQTLNKCLLHKLSDRWLHHSAGSKCHVRTDPRGGVGSPWVSQDVCGRRHFLVPWRWGRVVQSVLADKWRTEVRCHLQAERPVTGTRPSKPLMNIRA